MSLQVGKAIYHILHNDADVVARVENKIFPLVANESTTFPFIIYKRTGLESATSKDRFIFKETATVEVIVASDKYNESVEIANLVKEALEGKQGIYSDIDIIDVRMTNTDENFIQDTFIQNLTFSIIINGKRN